MMMALGIIYLQFRAFNGLEATPTFYFHLNVLKAIFGVP
jgi:hypothetical protein